MALSENKRTIIGVCVLLIANIIWVLSPELNNFIFKTENYSKPFLSTYLQSSMLTFLLFGFICSNHWKMLACPQRYYSSVCHNIPNSSSYNDSQDEINILSEPSYVPINNELPDEDTNRYLKSDNVSVNYKEETEETSKRSVKFSNYKEVRHLSETYAEESLAARMSYTSYRILKKRIMIQKIVDQGLYPATNVLKFALQFCFCWLVAKYAYQRSYVTAKPSVTNAISSMSSLFTVIFSAMFPSSKRDHFTVTKLILVFLSIVGVTLMNYPQLSHDSPLHYDIIIWGLVSAFFTAVCLVNLRRCVKHEQQISIAMFLGFVGLWITITSWPFFFVLKWNDFETFEVPNGTELGSMLIDGLMSAVAADLLLVWGCFLTSSLVATLSFSFSVPLIIAVRCIIVKRSYDWIFFLCGIPIVVSFIGVVLLTAKSGRPYDPVGDVIRRIFCSYPNKVRYELISEQDPPDDVTCDNNNNHTITNTSSDHSNHIRPMPIFLPGMCLP